MKKFLGILLVASLLLTGCFKEKDVSEKTGKLKIGYVINNLNDTFQTLVLETAKEYALENDIELLIENPQEDTIRQQDIVNSLIQKGVDGLIVVPTDTSAMDPITKVAQDSKVPISYVNRNPFAGKESTMPKEVFYVGADEKSGGIMQMDYIGEKLNGKGGVAVLMGILGNEGALQRTEGVKEEMAKEFKKMSLLTAETGNWQRDQGLALTENFLTTYGNELKAVISNNDEMALGAIQALKTNGKLEDVLVIGLDAIPDAIASIEAGELSATVFQDPAQGRAAIEIIHKILKGENIENHVKYIPFKLVTKENSRNFK